MIHKKGNRKRVKSKTNLPYGTEDLDPVVVAYHENGVRRVRCYVRGCPHILRVPTRHDRGEVCPDHGIRCHNSSYGATYSYVDVRRNIIASPGLFATRIVGHPFKYESHRLGYEKSEDALSWNVFRSLQEAGCLAELRFRMTGEDHAAEPQLFLWGINVTDDRCEPWDLLIAARERFESHLPVVRPKTEPDIGLYLPGKYLILIEAKFTSPNTYYERGPRKDRQSLTFDELLNIYSDPSLEILDIEKARSQQRIYYQLWRNMVFAEWMAKIGSTGTIAYHVNLLRESSCDQLPVAFSRLVRDRHSNRFLPYTWEEIFRGTESELTILASYTLTKTASLLPAFQTSPCEKTHSKLS